MEPVGGTIVGAGVGAGVEGTAGADAGIGIGRALGSALGNWIQQKLAAHAAKNNAGANSNAGAHCKNSQASGSPQKPEKEPPDENKLHHIFGNPSHNLGPLLKAFKGDQVAAAQALQELGQLTADGGLPDGGYTVQGSVNDVPANVTGQIQDGTFSLGTAYSP